VLKFILNYKMPLLTITRITLLIVFVHESLQQFECVSPDKFYQKYSDYITKETLESQLDNKTSNKIGQGVFGSIQKIPWNDTTLPEDMRFIAVKTCLLTIDNYLLRQEGEYLERLSQTDSKNFPKFFGCIESDDGLFHLAMEYLQNSLEAKKSFAGESVTNLVYEQFRSLPVSARLHAYSDLAGSINFMHEIGIIHNDIKPANIVVKSLGARPELKLIDFGLAEDKGVKSRGGTLVYMDKAKLLDIFRGEFLNTEINLSENSVKGELADLFALFVTIYMLENAWRITVDEDEHIFPLSLRSDYSRAEAYRTQLIISEQWMVDRDLKICINDNDCFSHLVERVVAPIRSKVAETPRSVAIKLQKFAKIAKESEEERNPQVSFLYRIKTTLANIFGCTNKQEVINTAITRNKII
jgi:serine/threonine protein kinase